MLHVDQLLKRFHSPDRGEFAAVDRLSFSVSPGEIFGLLGPNGAGKTTTLRMIATLLPPDSGSVDINGIDGQADPIRARAQLAYVPAEGGLPDRLTPREVVQLFARVQGVDGSAQKTDHLLERLGCADYADTPCGGLSTGMKRRVILCRALVHDPQVLLLDEPTDGLDVPGRNDVIALIRGYARDGKTVVVSSHIMSEVERLVDRLCVMASGTIRAEGTLPALLAKTGASSLDEAFVALLQ